MEKTISRNEAIQLFEGHFKNAKGNNYFNKELWKKHSLQVAHGSEILAESLSLSKEEAFVNGLLHDIGKAINPNPKKHAIAGYELLKKETFLSAAQTALTHDFPEKNLQFSLDDGLIDDNEMERLQKIFAKIDYRLIDKIVQIIDVIAMPDGFVLMEKRMLNAVMRCGKLTKTLEQIIRASQVNIKEINGILGYSFYKCLPNVIENSLSF